MNLIFSILSIVTVLILAFLLIGFTIYFVFWKQPTQEPICSINSECEITQICEGNCVNEPCKTKCDKGVCFQGFCTPEYCQITNDCPQNQFCFDNQCISTGGTCQDNNDCFHSSCLNNVCSQCVSNTNCNVGQQCENSVCFFPSSGDDVFISPAKERGNVAAPPGYYCDGLSPSLSCDVGCPQNLPYCVNEVCRCVPGVWLETCSVNSDCVSGVCNSGLCIEKGGICAFNENCPPNVPYCVQGSCVNSNLGSTCGSREDCVQGEALFCVEGLCSMTPGNPNQYCNGDSCSFGLMCVENKCIL